MFKGIFNFLSGPSQKDIIAFGQAAAYGEIAEVQKLIDTFGKDIINQPDRKTGYTALMQVAISGEFGREEMRDFLLAQGAELDKKAKDGSTALILAVKAGRELMSIKLMERGANLDAQADDGRNALMEAVRAEDRGLMTGLLFKGANPLLRDKDGHDAADLARSTPLTQENHERIELMVAALDKASEDFRTRTAEQLTTQVTQGLSQGLDKAINVSRPVRFKT